MLSGGYAGYKYLVVAAAVSVRRLGYGSKRGYKAADDRIEGAQVVRLLSIAITTISR